MKAKEPEAAGPGSTLRTTINVLLMLHFAFLGVTILSNIHPASEFRTRLGRIPFAAYYAQLLSQDVGYNTELSNFALTSGPFERDHPCRMLLDWREEAANDPVEFAKLEKIELLPSGIWLGTRRQRYLQLGLVASLNEENPDAESRLPTAIATFLLRQANDRQPTVGARHRFQCNARRLQDLEDLVSDDPARRDPLSEHWLNAGYEANVIGTGEQWALIKIADRGEVTQVKQQPSPPIEKRQDSPGEK